ncbi:unnamed protein product [Parnassius apollo]|uniref:(apollo) hypothetical protein n=1 Tax=Parnassius apollo TaxID=110799 RepID=A0A8S3YC05_PARAO|nr:unnamed protein product [Parnassius apollo]
MHAQVYILAVFCLAAGVFPGNLPPFIHPCSKSDPNLNQCVEKAIQVAGPLFADGIPELGIAPLDPMKLGTVDVENPALNLVFTDTVVTGLKDFRVNSYKINTETGKAVFDFTANVTLSAKYNMDGRVLILDIRGNGQADIIITNLNIVIKYDYETKDGHWVVPKYKDNYKMDKAQFRFTNLFGGKNKELAATTLAFINESWEIIMQDISPPSIKNIIKRCVEEAKKLFAAVPAAELMLP